MWPLVPLFKQDLFLALCDVDLGTFAAFHMPDLGRQAHALVEKTQNITVDVIDLRTEVVEIHENRVLTRQGGSAVTPFPPETSRPHRDFHRHDENPFRPRPEQAPQSWSLEQLPQSRSRLTLQRSVAVTSSQSLPSAVQSS